MARELGRDGQMSRRTLVRAGAAVGLGALLPWGVVGCGDEKDTGRSGSSAGGKITIPAPSLGLLGNAPLHVASAQGFFRDAGLTVALADVIGTDVIRSVQTQSVVGVAGAIPSIVAFSKGVKDLRIIAPMYSAAQNTFIAPTGSKVRTLADLRPGMKVGAAIPSTPPTYFAEALVRKAGLKPGDDVEIVNLGRAPDAWTAAKKGLVDVVWSNPPFDTALIEAGEAHLVLSAAELRPAWADTVLAATNANVEGQEAQLRAVVDGIAKAHALIRDDPQTAARAWAKNAKLDPKIASAALRSAPATAWRSDVDPAGIAACVEAATELKLVSGKVDVATLVSKRFAPAAR